MLYGSPFSLMNKSRASTTTAKSTFLYLNHFIKQDLVQVLCLLALSDQLLYKIMCQIAYELEIL